MNSINSDLVFTTETERDFMNKRLPTLGFEIWSEKNGLRHSFFEKPMRSQILTMERSSQSERSKFSILVNELNRRFEMLDEDISIEEKKGIINHFSQQLVNSGYSKDKIREIICSGLKGVMRKEMKRKERNSRYRGAHETLGERLNKKLLEATTW